MMANNYQHLDIRERAMIEMYLAMGTRPGTAATIVSRPGRKLPTGARTSWPCWRASSPQARRFGS
ncbi:MAG: hypothetical protein ABR991_10070 [Terracidiphilus sp.]